MAQWAGRRLRSLRRTLVFRQAAQTVRTVEIVECLERTALLVPVDGGLAETCPLCGSRLEPGGAHPSPPQLPPPPFTAQD